MNCQRCEGPVKKFGKDRGGNQRFRCDACKVTFTEPHEKKPRLVGTMILTEEKIIECLHPLVEGCSIRSTERLTGVHRDTILRLLETAGKKCEEVMIDRIKGLRVSDVQCDEQWQYIGMKQKTKNNKGIEDESLGDSWVFTAFERHSKLILAWHLGHRTENDTIQFTEKLAYATEGSFQVTTDGFKPYQHAIVLSLGAQHIDFAQLVKIYVAPREGEARYSPAECTGCKKVAIYGDPNPAMVSTSHVERHNLSTRMQSRRYTRLTNAFSKKWNKHHSALALWYAYYNFCRVHRSLRVTPAMEAGITDHVWSIKELLNA
jgi:transposase-like protein/IS1 family transposase